MTTILASSSRGIAAVFVAWALCAAAGCTGQVVTETDGGGGDGGSTATTSSSTASGSGGSGGAPSVCVEQPQGTGGFKEPTCADLSVLTISNPLINDNVDVGGDGNGEVNVGETVVLWVEMTEVAGVGFNMYPGVVFSTNDPGVTVTADNWLYAILPCMEVSLAGSVTIGPDVAPGTVVTVRAQANMLGAECTDTPFVDVPITVH
jgi:hypothetical protein